MIKYRINDTTCMEGGDEHEDSERSENQIGGWLRSRISRLFRAKLRDVLSSLVRGLSIA